MSMDLQQKVNEVTDIQHQHVIKEIPLDSLDPQGAVIHPCDPRRLRNGYPNKSMEHDLKKIDPTKWGVSDPKFTKSYLEQEPDTLCPELQTSGGVEWDWSNWSKQEPKYSEEAVHDFNTVFKAAASVRQSSPNHMSHDAGVVDYNYNCYQNRDYRQDTSDTHHFWTQARPFDDQNSSRVYSNSQSYHRYPYNYYEHQTYIQTTENGHFHRQRVHVQSDHCGEFSTKRPYSVYRPHGQSLYPASSSSSQPHSYAIPSQGHREYQPQQQDHSDTENTVSCRDSPVHKRAKFQTDSPSWTSDDQCYPT